MYFMNGTISLDIHSLFIGALKLHDYSLQFSQIYGGDSIRSKIYESLIKYRLAERFLNIIDPIFGVIDYVTSALLTSQGHCLLTSNTNLSAET